MAKVGDLKIEILKTSDLIPYARNSRTHSPEQVGQIAGSIREFGFTNPVLIDGDNNIIAGHCRVMAAQKLGMENVPCIRLDHLTDTQRRAYVIADNRLGLNSGWNEEMLGLELADLREVDFDLSLTGFDGEEFVEAWNSNNLDINDGFAETSNQSDELADVVFTLGQCRFTVGREIYLQWQETIKQESGFSNADFEKEIKRRLKL